MRTRLILWIACPLAVLVAAILAGSQVAQLRAQAVGQTPSSTEQSDSPTNHNVQKETMFKASDVIGMAVRSKIGDAKIGSINDLVLGQDGRVRYVAVSFGGFLGMGSKLFAVPFEAIDFVNTGGAYARIDVSEEALKLNKGFNHDDWPTEADPSFSDGNMRRQAAVSSIAR